MSKEELAKLEAEIKELEGIESEILDLRQRSRKWGIDSYLLDVERNISRQLNDRYIERARATRG